MKFKVKSKKLLVNEYFKVEKTKVVFDQHFTDESVEVTRFNLLRGIAVATLLYDRDKDAIVLVRQFRYSTAEAGHPWLVELPAGLTEPKEEPVIAAKRETLEETGYKIDELKEIMRFYVAPGCTDEMIIIYYGEVDNAMRITQGGGAEGENEDIKIIMLPVPEIADFLERETVDAKTIIGLNWFLANRTVNRKQ